ncbi:Retrovirus-related Pol polyprotein from transposon RE2 [Sesamum angolense]|uniref:Retrovirus-related Pol polyprotein from transposon RE2 n=1 Tax=Sesamum angolense TaxID=2727404 RepID=A0AAE1WB88_9LAMI|nr:Retrovirus-related Pol polyprotein from transposon RE2 [Sesamum angolense]
MLFSLHVILLNRMPSTVLHGETPYSCLFPDKPLFGITPRVFGKGIGVMILSLVSPLHLQMLLSSNLLLSTPTVSCRHSSTLSSLACPHIVCSPTYRATYPAHYRCIPRRNRSTTTTLIVPPDLPPTAAPGNPSATPTDDIPIALRKGATTPAWKMAMDDEMSALVSRGTWKLVEVPPNADIVACRWVFTLKFRADGTLERYKARLVAKGFTQTYGVDYFETFSPVARLNSIRVLFSLAVNLSWPMYHMDIKNAFLYGDLNETVYMEQPPGYVAQGRSNEWCAN